MKTFCLAFAALVLSGVSSFAQADLIRVTGQAEMKRPPDIAWVSLEVWSRAKNAKRAQELNAEEHSRVLDVLKREFKLKPEQIRSAGYQLNPDYDYSNNRRTLKGYAVSHPVEVAIRALDRLGDLMDELSSNQKADAPSGVNLAGVRFGTEKQNAYELEVIESAMKDARARADAIARAAGRSVKSVRNVVHGTSSGPIMPMMAMAADMRAEKSMGRAATQVSPGELTISTEVTAEYEF